MSKKTFNILPTMIGSMPYTDPQKAMLQVIKYLPQIPTWPQLPKRGYHELMTPQMSQGFPGLILDDEGNAIVMEAPFQEELQKLYENYLTGDFKDYSLTPQYSAGFTAYMNTASLSPMVAKGQITSPITFAQTVKDQSGRAILYDDIKREAACIFLKLKAMWQESQLKRHSENTLIFLDEPALVSFGSAYLQINEETVTEMLTKVLEGLIGMRGIHVCGTTNWEMLLKIELLDVLNFDSFHYADNLQIYDGQVKDFFTRGRAIAWGCVPTNEEELKNETMSSLRDRLEENMAFYSRGQNAICFKDICAQSILTPSCGLGTLSEEVCETALSLLSDLSQSMRSKYGSY